MGRVKNRHFARTIQGGPGLVAIKYIVATQVEGKRTQTAQADVVLNAHIHTSLGLQQTEVAYIALRIEAHAGIDAPALGQFDGVIPAHVQVRPVKRDGSAVGCRCLVVLEEQIDEPCRMPAADSGTGVGVETQLVIVLLGVDGTYQTDKRVVGTGVWL